MKINHLTRSISTAVAILSIFFAGVLFSKVWEVPEKVSAVVPVAEKPAGGVVSGFPSFAEMVKHEKPAVVNISTTKIIKERGLGGHPQTPNDPFRDFFGDDFFERFFDQMPKREYKTQNLGSGVIISKDGFILTNNHVIENADEIIVKLSDEREFKADIVGRDSKTDVALIKIKDHDNLPVATLGDSDKLEVGEWVVAIGNPFGVGQTVTAGIVSAKGREIGAGPYDDFIQTDASINPGNSGGPLFNTRGEVVGINTAIYSPSGGNVGIGFAIPINMVTRLLSQLKEKGEVTRGWLGVMIQPITKELAESFGLDTNDGALVADVVEKSPAERAGLKRGDVIVEFDGEKIGKMRELPTMVAATPVDKKVKVVVLRNGKKKVLTALIEKLKEEGVESSAPGVWEDLGMTVQEITPDLVKELDLEKEEGVIVTQVERGSPAGGAGLRRGDVVLQINRKPIRGVRDFKREVKRFKKGDRGLLLVLRGRNTFYATIKVED